MRLLSLSVYGRRSKKLIKHRRSAVETMLETGFKPERTFVLAFGFDEEASGQFVRT